MGQGEGTELMPFFIEGVGAGLDPDDPGDSIVYTKCDRGDACPDRREGTYHAHLQRPSGADVTPPLRNTAPDVPDVR